MRQYSIERTRRKCEGKIRARVFFSGSNVKEVKKCSGVTGPTEDDFRSLRPVCRRVFAAGQEGTVSDVG